MTRVCGEHQDYQRYISTCDVLLRSPRKTWVNECLENVPVQSKILFAELSELILTLIEDHHAAMLDRLKPRLIGVPVSQWTSLIKQSAPNTSQVAYNTLTLNHVLAELQTSFGPVHE